jgi:hypothetical protein
MLMDVSDKDDKKTSSRTNYLFFIRYLALTIQRRAENYTYLSFSDGVRCKWNNGMTIYVSLEKTYMKQVTGLCGTYTNQIVGKKINYLF